MSRKDGDSFHSIDSVMLTASGVLRGGSPPKLCAATLQMETPLQTELGATKELLRPFREDGNTTYGVREDHLVMHHIPAGGEFPHSITSVKLVVLGGS